MKEGMKYDKGKRRFSLFPTQTLYAVLDVLEYGARKYSENNWRKVPDARARYFDAALRHLHAWWVGEAFDEESGHYHLSHAICCLVFLLSFDLENERL